VTDSPGKHRLVLVTGDGPGEHYVANRLCAALPIDAIVVDATVRQPSLRRAFRGGRARGFSRLGLFAFRRLLHDSRAHQRALEQLLGTEWTAGFTAAHLVTRVDGVNSAAAIRAVDSAQPDALLVFGTSIVGPEMLGLARDLAFNLHTGVSPRYRGTDCTFWPVVNGEPEWVGVTVHECTAAVDGGAIYGVARAEWRPDDRLHELFARCLIRGTDLYVEVVRRYLRDGGIEGERQDLSSGTEYRGYMRTLGPELRARWALRRGLLKRATANPHD
jgi:folate-dependent phosphoribosylglycinamide formyltransferase PurN